jgi:hypothetical protein
MKRKLLTHQHISMPYWRIPQWSTCVTNSCNAHTDVVDSCSSTAAVSAYICSHTKVTAHPMRLLEYFINVAVNPSCTRSEAYYTHQQGPPSDQAHSTHVPVDGRCALPDTPVPSCHRRWTTKVYCKCATPSSDNRTDWQAPQQASKTQLMCKQFSTHSSRQTRKQYQQLTQLNWTHTQAAYTRQPVGKSSRAAHVGLAK